MLRWVALLSISLMIAGCGMQPRAAAPRTAAVAAAKTRTTPLERMEQAWLRGDRQIFDLIDAGGDGRLQRAEWDGRCLGHEWWATIETNLDGLVDFAEFAPAELIRRAALSTLALCDDEMATHDADGNGWVEGQELEGYGVVMTTYDADGDRRISLTEVQRWWERFVGGEIGTIAWPECPPGANGGVGRVWSPGKRQARLDGGGVRLR